jgi:hypothetical protein
MNLLKGRMSHRWKQFATTHVRSKKLFESPDTVNNLIYDSQKCWTALAKIFLDKAESRIPSTYTELLPRYLTTRAGIG